MKPRYSDILERVPDEPVWWTQHGVPRFCRFEPNRGSDVYATWAVLLRIECQYCSKEFDVELVWGSFTPSRPEVSIRSWRENPRYKWFPFRYGDPPSHNCTGDTMSSVPLRVLACYHHNKDGSWERIEGFEIENTEEGIKAYKIEDTEE